MSRRVLKWPVPVDDQDHPIGAGPVVLVASQLAADLVFVWTEEDVDDPRPPMRRARVYGTGQSIPDPSDEHVGSALAGPFVWHVYAAQEVVSRG